MNINKIAFAICVDQFRTPCSHFLVLPHSAQGFGLYEHPTPVPKGLPHINCTPLGYNHTKLFCFAIVTPTGITLGHLASRYFIHRLMLTKIIKSCVHQHALAYKTYL